MIDRVLSDNDLSVIQNFANQIVRGRLLTLVGRRLLISGGTGFLGRWLVESLCMLNDRLSLGNEMYLITRSIDRAKASVSFSNRADVKFIQLDVAAGDCLDLPVCDFVIHAATDVVLKVAPLAMFDTCIDGTRTMLNLAKKSAAKKFLLFSSGAIYGNAPGAPARYSEDYCGAPEPDQPHWGYASGKRAAEYMASAFCDEFGIRVAIARCFAFVGPGIPLDGPFAVSDFISGALSKDRRILIKGDGSTVRSYMYATDFVNWILEMLVSEEDRLTLNVGGDQELKMIEVAELVARSFKYRIDIEFQRDPSILTTTYLPDLEQAFVRGFNLEVGSIEAVSKTLKYFNEDRQA